MPPKSKINIKQLIDFYINKKLSSRDISPLIGASKSAISNQIKKHNLSRTNRQSTIRDRYGRFIKPDQNLPPRIKMGRITLPGKMALEFILKLPLIIFQKSVNVAVQQKILRLIILTKTEPIII